MEDRRKFSERMRNGEFLVSIQIDPPGQHDDIVRFKETIRKLIDAGVTLVDINSSRRVSHDSIQLACYLARFGLSVIPHVTTRDSSLNGLANQIIAAYDLEGIRSFLIITGDPHDVERAIMASRGVFQTDAAGAIRLLNQIVRDHGVRLQDIEFAAAINQNAINERSHLLQKVQNGADFFMSQPIFCVEQAERLFKFYTRSNTPLPLMIGIWPLLHKRTAEAIHKGNIVGVVIPGRLHEAIQAKDEKDLPEWGLGEAADLIDYIQNSGKAGGVYIVAPLRNPLLIAPLLKKFVI